GPQARALRREGLAGGVAARRRGRGGEGGCEAPGPGRRPAAHERGLRRDPMELNQTLQAKPEQLPKLSPVARGGVPPPTALAIFAGYFGLLFQDTHARLEKVRAQEFELQRRLTEVRSVAANLHDFEEEIAGLELKLSKVLRQLPDKKELEVLLTDISNLG